MGLDSVELVIRFEDAFGLNISDDDACRMRTPRDVIEYVMTRVEQSQSVCLSQQVFYSLRREWCEQLNVTRISLRPATLLDDLVHKRNRRATWERLCASKNATWHQFDLTRPKWMRVSLWLVPLIVLVGLTARDGFGIGLLYAVAVAYAAYILTLRFKTNFPEDKTCVADVVRFSLLDMPQRLNGERKTWTRDEVAETVRRITLEEIGLSPRKYKEDARFVEDLGID